MSLTTRQRYEVGWHSDNGYTTAGFARSKAQAFALAEQTARDKGNACVFDRMARSGADYRWYLGDPPLTMHQR